MTDEAGKSGVTRRRAIAGASLVGVGAIAGAGYMLDHPGGAIVPGRSRARPVPSDSVLPKQVDVVVIGGGNIGTSTALQLAERGLSVALFEKGVIAGEASGRSFGLVESFGLDPVKMPLVGRTKELWANWNARTGHETGYARNGLVSLIISDEQRGWIESWITSTRGLPGCDARIIDGKQLSTLMPGVADSRRGAVYQPSDAQAEPQLAAPAMAMGARLHGAKIFQGCAVRGLETKGGQISAVVTEKGTVACRAVVLAGGSWSPLFLKSLGVSLPQFEASGSMMTVSLKDGAPKLPGTAEIAGWRPQLDGRISIGQFYIPTPIVPDTFRYLPQLLPNIGAALQSTYPVFSLSTFWEKLMTPNHWALDRPSPFEAHRILMPELAPDVLKSTIDGASKYYPAFRQAKITETWAGFMSTTLDNMPVVGPIASVPGLFVGSGFNFGLMMAPAVGEALADLVTARKTQFDLHPYRLERFSDGTKLTFSE